jgi:hypothetical protein
MFLTKAIPHTAMGPCGRPVQSPFVMLARTFGKFYGGL